MRKPKPLDETKDPDQFWCSGEHAYHDPFDQFIPRGFLSDLVYYFRGTEVPTVYAIWAGLCAISAVVKREAHVKWFPGQFFANLYVILIGPASTKKSTILGFIVELLQEYHLYIENEGWRDLKRLNVMKNKSSPEGILESMLPGDDIRVKDESGNERRVPSTSEMFIGLTELSVMLNKQHYNESMISNLLDLYDCHGTWEWTTKGDKKRILKNLHTTFLAATTPAGYKDAVPEAAIGDGFLSRVISAYSNISNRCFWRPIPTKEGPTKEDLLRRLAYIAQAVQGPYDLTKEADDYGREWYRKHKKTLRDAGEDLGLISRQDNHLLKVAFLLKAQSYPMPDDKIIDMDLMRQAEKLLKATYLTSYHAINEVKHNKGEFEHVYKMKAYMMERGQVVRKSMMSALRFPKTRFQEVLTYLFEQGDITVWSEDGERKKRPSHKSTEVYRYEGKVLKGGEDFTELGV